MSSNDGDNSAPSLYSNRSRGDRPQDDATGDGKEEQATEAGPNTGAPGGEESDVDPEAAERHLNDLLSDRNLRQLMQSGKYEAFRNDLRRRQSQTDDPDRLAAIEYALANPDEFAEPIQSAPTLWTLNGIGLKVYGTDQQDPQTGLYLTTQYLTLLWVPIFPIARYLARSFGDEYQFFAKVDLSGFHHWWRRIVVACFVAIAGFVAYGVATMKPDVRFVNGLDEPVDISVDGKETIDVPARSVRVKELPAGKHTFTTTYDQESAPDKRGSKIETTTYDVPQYEDLVVYNVAGLAPAYVRSVTYYSTTAASRTKDGKPEMPDIKLIAGQKWYTNDDIDYFSNETPPEEIEMATGSDKEVHWRFRYDGEGPATAARMISRHDPGRMGEFLKEAIRLDPTADWYHFDVRMHLSNLAEDNPEKLDEWLDFLKETAWNHPAEMSLHILYVSEVEAYSDKLDRPDPRKAYRKHHKSKQSAESALMLAHVVSSRSEAKTLLETVVEKAKPGSALAVEAHGQLGSMYGNQRKCKTALNHFENTDKTTARLADSYLHAYAVCLALTGKVERALKLMSDFATTDSPSGLSHAITYGRIVLHADLDRDPLGLFKKLAQNTKALSLSDDFRVLLAIRMGSTLSEEKLSGFNLSKRGKGYAKISTAMREGPNALLDTFRNKPDRLSSVDASLQTFALLLEYAQKNEGKLDKLLNNASSRMGHVVGWVKSHSGTEALQEPPPIEWYADDRAAYYAVRGAVASDADAKKKALERARSEMQLHGPLSVIIDQQLASL